MSSKPLIVAATSMEIAPSIPSLERLGIPYLITGVGMVATAHSLTKAMLQSRPAYVLNVGIAGSFGQEIPIGSTVEIIQETLSELGAETADSFIPIDQLGFGLSCWSNKPPQKISTHLRQVSAITVNTVHGNQRSIEKIQQRFPSARTESMEGAAVFYVCQTENVPCLQVRSISNYVEQRNTSSWDIPLAVKNLNTWLAEFLHF